MHRAVVYNKLACVQALIESGKVTDLEDVDMQDNTSLQLAVAYGYINIVNLLVKNKADVKRGMILSFF